MVPRRNNFTGETGSTPTQTKLDELVFKQDAPINQSKTITSSQSNESSLPIRRKRQFVKWLMLISLIGLVINFLAFISLTIISVLQFDSSHFSLSSALYYYGNACSRYNELSLSQLLVMISQKEIYATRYYKNRQDLNEALHSAYELVPQANITWNSSVSYLKKADEVVELVAQGKHEEAESLYSSDEHINSQVEFMDFFLSIVNEVLRISEEKESQYLEYSITSLIVVCVCLCVAIPIVVMIFTCVMKMDRDSKRELDVAKALTVIHSISDPFLRPLLKNHVVKNEMKYFNFLEQVQLFKERKRSLRSTIQSILDEMKMNRENDTNGSLNDEENESIMTFSSDLFTQLKPESGEIQAIDIYNRFLNPKQAKIDLIKYSSHKKVFEEISTLCDQEQQSTIFDQAQIEIAKKLIKAHDIFTHSQSFSNHGIEHQLLSYRAEYLSVFKPEKQRKSIFTIN